MIQRVQSVFLALVAICMLALYFTSIVTVTYQNKKFIFSIFGLNEQGSENLNFLLFPTFLFGLTTTIVLLSFYCITAFKNRINQMKFVRLNTLLILIFIVVDVLAYDKIFDIILATNKNFSRDSSLVTYLFGSVTPVFALIFNILAFRGIKKDEDLVRSANRIR